jgi:site-specific DNA recombinase
VNETEATLVRRIFERFVRLGSATKLVVELTREGVRHKRGKPIDKGFLYKLLNNRLYIGEPSTRDRATPASTTPSSPRISGTRSTPSSARALASAPRTRARRRRRC